MSEVESYNLISDRRRNAAGMLLAITNFMVVLDLTIANVSVPHIAGNLGISPDQGTWVITSYAVAEAICVPLTGWLAQRFGAVRVFSFSVAGFGLFSLLCGLAPTLGMLVACRIGQGICGGPLMPMSQTLLMRIYAPEQRPRAMGAWAMTTLLGPALGPIVGGYISDNWSWHWIFLINVPIAALCAFASYSLLRPVDTPTEKRPIDIIGLCLLVFWIGCLQIMLDIGRDHDWFGDPLIVMLAIAAVLGLVVFVIWELTDEHPIVDLRVFRHSGFTNGVITLALCFGAYFAGIVAIPQWLQISMGYTATMAGLMTSFTAMTALITAPFAAKFMTRMDPRIMVSAAVLWLACFSFMRSGWTTSADFWHLAIPQIMQGFAMPFFMIPMTTLSLGAVEPEETASAAGLQNFLRTMSLAVATSLVLTVWGNAQRASRNDITSVLQPADTQAQLSGAGLDGEQSRQMIANLVDGQTMVVALDYTFLLATVIMLLCAVIVWMTPRPKGPVDMSAAH